MLLQRALIEFKCTTICSKVIFRISLSYYSISLLVRPRVHSKCEGVKSN